jgi:DNA polymerase III subunit delta'
MSWSRIRGHARQIDAFSRAIRTNRLAHAYLFAGPPGVGKKLFGIELAKALLCESPPKGGFDACDKCASCILVDAGTHPDLAIVGKPIDKHELPIAVMRGLCGDLALKPARGGRRIAIVDDADDLNEEAANCFLKTLEEPPAGSMLILIGTDPERQLPTIRSRCQQIVFEPLIADEIAELLQQEGTTDPALIGRLTRLADGSPGLARELSNPAYWKFRQSFLGELKKQKPDSVGIAKQWAELYEAAGKDSALQRQRAGLILQLMLDAYRQALREEPDAFADPIEGQLLADLNRRFGPDGLLDRIERCLDAEMQIDRRVQLVLLVEAIVDALTQEGGIEKFRPAWSV